MNAVLATTKLIARRAGEAPFDVELSIGTPYQVGSDPEEWACPVALTPLFKRLHDAHGVDSFQALFLAIRLGVQLLEAFREQGGVLSMSPDEEFPLDLYSSGLAKGVFGDSETTERDDSLRGSEGIVCSIRERESGKLRVVLDDVTNSEHPSPGPWLHRGLFTWKDYEPEALEQPEDLPDVEMANFGFNILVRLLAMRRHDG